MTAVLMNVDTARKTKVFRVLSPPENELANYRVEKKSKFRKNHCVYEWCKSIHDSPIRKLKSL